MAFTTLTLGLTLTIPTNGTKNWGTTLRTTTWTKISEHNHTGSGDGNQMVTASYTDNSVTDPKIRLTNTGWLRARNAAGNADINLIRVNSSDGVELGVALGQKIQTSTLTPVGTTQTADFALGAIVRLALGSASGDVTLTFIHPVAGAQYTFLVTQGGTARDLIYPASVIWPQAQKPILSTDNGAVDKITFLYDGTSYYGDWELNYA